MAGICCGVVVDGETPTPTSRPSRRRNMELLSLKYIADSPENSRKRQRVDLCLSLVPEQPLECENAVECSESSNTTDTESKENGGAFSVEKIPKYGVTSVCGRRRDMEDACSICPSFSQNEKPFHFFGVYDGHGCSHVATMCKERLHEIVDEEVEKEKENLDWKSTMEKSFSRMDEEVLNRTHRHQNYTCKCELQTPHCDAVGSTAVVAVITLENIIVSNCGDSRAVLCRNGVAIPLSSDHKPDRADELDRINAAGGRVIYWDGARVLGVLAMSRAIGDNYLKPYVIPEPEVTVIERSDKDECLILASDGLWDVVRNDTACKVALMCLKAEKPSFPPGCEVAGEGSDKACSYASILLTKLALARNSSDNVSVVVVDLSRDRPLLKT